MKNRIVILAALFLVIVLIVGLILIKNHIPNNDTGNTYYNSISAKNIFDIYSVASEVLSESDLEQTTSFTDEEQEFISQNFHLTYSIAEEENTLTVEEIDENISNFQNDYLNFLKICKTKGALEHVQKYCGSILNRLQNLKSAKTMTQSEKNNINELAFYTTYNHIVSELSGLSDEQLDNAQKERLDIAERAKKYYEDGTITIDQACQALMISGPVTTYDETFSLPE